MTSFRTAFSVLIMGISAWTSTVVWVVPNSIWMRPIARFWKPFSSRSLIVFVRKPAAVIVTSYLLATSDGSEKMPTSLVTVFLSEFVESWTILIDAPGMGASDESTIVPVIEPSPA